MPFFGLHHVFCHFVYMGKRICTSYFINGDGHFRECYEGLQDLVISHKPTLGPDITPTSLETQVNVVSSIRYEAPVLKKTATFAKGKLPDNPDTRPQKP